MAANVGSAPSCVVHARALRHWLCGQPWGHPWIYASDVLQRPRQATPVVTVLDTAQRVYGYALYSPRSKIALRRVLLPTPQPSVAQLGHWLRQQVVAAWQRRYQAGYTARDAYRLLHGEADLLPGLFVDRYGACLVLQSSCAAADRWIPTLAAVLQAMYKPRLIVWRNDSRLRQHEKLTLQSKLLWQAGQRVAPEAPPPSRLPVRYHEGPLLFETDLWQGQKTGSFLDQVDNHLQLRHYSRGATLDLCTYQGGFALHMAATSQHCWAFDRSATALAQARRNAQLQGCNNVTFGQENLATLLPALLQQARRFDTIVLDPPAFAGSTRSLEAALRAYKEVNKRALQLLQPGGVLLTCSCSGRVSAAAFDSMLWQASLAAKRLVHVVEARRAGSDHPLLLGVPETDYLTVRLLRAL